MRSRIIILLIVILIAGCKREIKDIRTVDFSRAVQKEQPDISGPGKEAIKVAVAAILSPRETFSTYEDILRYIGSKLDVPVEFHQRRTYGEINNMLEKGQLDFAFICSGAYVRLNGGSGSEILSVPVSHGKPYYQAYVIVPVKSPAREFKDLKGMNFAYTDLLSHTGYLYALHRISEVGEDQGAFFASTIFTNAHDVSIQMVAKGLVDGATIDGLVFDYLKEKEPDRVRDIRIIEISEYFGIPPVVASSRMDAELKERVRDILQNMHLDDQGRELIEGLLIDRFIEGNDADYDGIRLMRSRLEGATRNQ
jgi:phosphonate transport system substrate-binding protein